MKITTLDGLYTAIEHIEVSNFTLSAKLYNVDTDDKKQVFFDDVYTRDSVKNWICSVSSNSDFYGSFWLFTQNGKGETVKNYQVIIE